jgi:hypothetical protein
MFPTGKTEVDMKRVLLALAAFAAVTAASAQPDQYRDRYRHLDPEVRAALQHYCQIMRARHDRNSAVVVPRICYRMFPQPPRRYP